MIRVTSGIERMIGVNAFYSIFSAKSTLKMYCCFCDEYCTEIFPFVALELHRLTIFCIKIDQGGQTVGLAAGVGNLPR
jgi:hypothetical protein